MGVSISVYCLRGGKGPSQPELVSALAAFVGEAGAIVGQTSGSGVGFTVQLELAPQEDRDQ
jgi:hypothetical protein